LAAESGHLTGLLCDELALDSQLSPEPSRFRVVDGETFSVGAFAVSFRVPDPGSASSRRLVRRPLRRRFLIGSRIGDGVEREGGLAGDGSARHEPKNKRTGRKTRRTLW
jgi:hypothetical protein